MRPLLHEVQTAHSPESLVERLRGETGMVLLRSALFESAQARYSFVATRPFLTLRAFASRCELSDASGTRVQFGDPWRLLDALMSRYELLDEVDLPFPLGGCFGFWGYDLKNFVEPRLPRRAVNDLELPDCHVGFHDSLVVFDHRLGKTWVVSTGLRPDGSRDAAQARRALEWWRWKLEQRSAVEELPPLPGPLPLGGEREEPPGASRISGAVRKAVARATWRSAELLLGANHPRNINAPSGSSALRPKSRPPIPVGSSSQLSPAPSATSVPATFTR